MSENRPKSKRKAPQSAYKPGQSGNPGGRPKTIAEVQEMARQHTTMAIAKLAEWAASDNPRASVAAANALLDRGWGRAPQHLNVAIAPSAMTDEQLNSMVAQGLQPTGMGDQG